MGLDHAAAIVEMRAILHERDTVSNRDFEMAKRTRTHSYRGRKDRALALYYMWRTGEVMTHHRKNFERVYALSVAVAPAHLLYESDEAAVNRFLILKDIRFSGLSRMNRVSDAFHRGVPFDEIQSFVKSLIVANFQGALARHGVEGVSPEGERFDPNLHESVALVDGAEANRVAAVYQKGFRLKGRLLRPARVAISRVATPPADG